ncbi:PATR-1 protein, partial [Aphelenchoides avenae]
MRDLSGLSSSSSSPGFNADLIHDLLADNLADLLAYHAQCWTSPASGNNLTNVSASFSGSTTSLNSRASRGKNLPSCRTISDYAFDPYAGFMSKKEREWLIKIQLIQCMRTGDPMDDDYYYTQWKKRNVLQKAPETWQKKIKPRYYNFEDTYPSAGYTPPSFTGSLGKPTHSSTSMPRQILDFHADVDDEESTVGRVNTQKKLRALLLRIENASLVLLECEEIRRKMDSLPDEERAAAAQKIEERMAMVQAGVFHKDQLPTVMLIQKGRAFVGQYLLAARGPHRSAALRLVFETLPRYAKKAADDQPNTTLTSSISRAFAELPSEDIGALLDGVPFDQLAAIFPVAP